MVEKIMHSGCNSQIRVGQLNLMESKMTIYDLPRLAKECKLDVILVQEQHCPGPPNLIQAGVNAFAGVYVASGSITCVVQHDIMNPCIAVCHLGGLYGAFIINATCKNATPINVHLSWLRNAIEQLRGRRIIVNHFIEHGPEADDKRNAFKDFFLKLGLSLHETIQQSNIDIYISRCAVGMIRPVVFDKRCGDRKLSTFILRLASAASDPRSTRTCVTPLKLRDKYNDWELYRARLINSISKINWCLPAPKLCEQFIALLIRETERITLELVELQKDDTKSRRYWKKTEREKYLSYKDMLLEHPTYQKPFAGLQLSERTRVAQTGDVHRSLPPTNIIPCLNLEGGYIRDSESVMQSLLDELCLDDNNNTDYSYIHKFNILAVNPPPGSDAPPPTKRVLRSIIMALPNRAPGLDGITAKMIKNLWTWIPTEVTNLVSACVREGVFPEILKQSRLLVLPKGNDKPLTDPRAYRPIMRLPIIGEILERVMLKSAPQLLNGFSDRQHGFVPVRNSVTALQAVLDQITKSTSTYVQAIFLDILGAFNNARWPIIERKVIRKGCPPNICRMLADYFINRHVGLFVGNSVTWKRFGIGLPQGSVLGPVLWNIFFNDLFSLQLPPSTDLIAFVDDVVVLVGAETREEIETKADQALSLIGKWAKLNKVAFSFSKIRTMTLKGKFQSPPTIVFESVLVYTAESVKYLGVVLDQSLSMMEHALFAGELAASLFTNSVVREMQHQELRLLYLRKFLVTLTYAAGLWYGTVIQHETISSALLRNQCHVLSILCKASKSVSMAALPVLAGVLPADLEVIQAGRLAAARNTTPKQKLHVVKRQIQKEIVDQWQNRWANHTEEREIHRFFPDVAFRLKATWVELDDEITQLLFAPGCIRSDCHCRDAINVHHVLWECPRYDCERRDMLANIRREVEGPVYYADLVGSKRNYEALKKFAHVWFKKRSDQTS